MKCDNLIRGGFSFCGVNIAELGLSYAPENENTYVYRPADVDVHEETFEGHNGGYFYGVSKQPKEFILRCYFEDSAIDQGIMERIYSLFRMGKSGKLVFDRTPWKYYYATVTSMPHPDLSNYLNGTITITLKAYRPYACGTDMYRDVTEEDCAQLMRNTAVLEHENMVPPMSFNNLMESTSLLLYNPGTEFAPLSIIAAGDAGLGVTIRNKTTKQECRIVAMTKEVTTYADKSVYIDGINGNTTLFNNEEAKPAFLYHDAGFIYLAPAYPCKRKIFVSSCNEDVVKLVNTVYDNVEGQYIYINDWYKIVKQLDSQTIKVEKPVAEMYSKRTIIGVMNEIEIKPDDTMDLSYIRFIYKPTYA